MPEELELWHGGLISAAFDLENTSERYSGALPLRSRRLHPWPISEGKVYHAFALIDYYYRFSRGSNELWTKAAGLHYDCARVFADMTHLDVQRAAWCYFTRQDRCEEVFVRFVEFMDRVHECCSMNGTLHLEKEIFNLDTIGDALWQVTCHVTRSLAPSAPPPPYTLHAFNIELPAMEWPQVQAEDVRLWSTNSGVSCKRTSPKAIQHAIIQNLLQLAAKSTESARNSEGPRVVEISEEEEGEDGEEEEDGEGVPLSGSAWETRSII